MGFNFKKLKFRGHEITIFKSWFSQIRGLIAWILKFDGQLGNWLKKSRTKLENARK
jgi:hypothetical protein